MSEEYEANNFDNYPFLKTEFISCVDCAEISLRTNDKTFFGFYTGQAAVFLQIITAKGWYARLKNDDSTHLKQHQYYHYLITRA